jgi:hypothetical protein
MDGETSWTDGEASWTDGEASWTTRRFAQSLGQRLA